MSKSGRYTSGPRKGNRGQREAEFSLLYMRISPVRQDGCIWHPCFYCGEPADTIDHCPPLSKVDAYRALRLANEMYLRVPCCRECNSLLGDSLQDDILQRERDCKARLARKYYRVLKLAEWTPEELAEMGPGLRKMIAGMGKIRTSVEARLEYAGGVNVWLDEYEFKDRGDDAA